MALLLFIDQEKIDSEILEFLLRSEVACCQPNILHVGIKQIFVISII